jgi:putative long chain acyl-CoA synthase
VAGGARLALARRFEPSTFWEEVRRYGVTIASYTWTMLHDLVEAPAQPGERHHPVRLFIGSGMPRGLWRRVERRFAPARVLEFYASTEAGAILVNLRARKPGSMGRPLPGSAEVRIAAYDIEAGRLRLRPDGFARQCRAGEVGMLLCRVDPGDLLSSTPLRGVFRRDDAWVMTGDLFTTDSDGDYWRVDSVREVIRTAGGPVFATPIRDALGDLGAVDLSVAYGVTPKGAEYEIAVAALTLKAGRELKARDIAVALSPLEDDVRPDLVHVVEEIPVTTWFRPMTKPLREAGIPRPTEGRPAWYRHGSTYKPLTAAARKRMVAQRARPQAPSTAPPS